MELNYFLNYFYPAFLLVFGFVGNFFGIMVISRKNLKPIGPVLIYRFLYFADSVYLSKYIFYNHI